MAAPEGGKSVSGSRHGSALHAGCCSGCLPWGQMRPKGQTQGCGRGYPAFLGPWGYSLGSHWHCDRTPLLIICCFFSPPNLCSSFSPLLTPPPHPHLSPLLTPPRLPPTTLDPPHPPTLLTLYLFSPLLHPPHCPQLSVLSDKGVLGCLLGSDISEVRHTEDFPCVRPGPTLSP